MPLKFVLLQHTDATTPGLVLPWLKSLGVPYQHVRLHHGETLPAPSADQAIILCGGGVHVDQDHLYPWLKAERRFIEESLRLGCKVVGLCLGGQLCAQILGARVAPHRDGWEIGWTDLHLNQTPGLAGFEKATTMKFSQYHRYIFDAPADARVVAMNDWWDPQAFLWKNQVLAFQFHPERDLESNRRLTLEKDLPTEGRVQPLERILTLGEIHQPLAALWFENLLNGFLLSSQKG